MKVLMLGWELPPHHTGGLGVVCYEMTKHLASRGVDIEFILPYTSDYEYKHMKVNSAIPQNVRELVRLNGIYESEKYKLVFTDGSVLVTDFRDQHDEYVNYVARFVEFAEFDIIHAHDWLTFRAGMVAKMVSGKPLIVHVHTTEFDRAGGQPGNPIVHDIEYHGLMMADKIFAVSQNTKDTITRHYGIPEERIEVVHNSVEVNPDYLVNNDNMYSYLNRMKQHGYKVVLSLGRLTIQKGLTQLLAAAKQVIEKDPKVIFLIVGDGELHYELLELAASYEISQNVVIVGNKRIYNTAKAWRDAFHVADLFVMPSVNEPFGITPLEAIYLGTPVLVSKQSGVSELLNHAFKVDFWDIDGMSNKILAAINNPSLLHEMLENSKRDLERITWDESADKMLKNYEDQTNGVEAI